MTEGHDHVGPAEEGYQVYRADPDTVFGYTTAAGEQKTIKADSGGLVVASNPEEEAVLRGFDLPHGRVTANDRERATPVVRRLTADEEKGS
jgi:hypothetical protein